MKTWDLVEWQQILTRTQIYVRNRLCGDRCQRDVIETWRYFYQTHEPVVRMLVSRAGLTGSHAERCVEQVWMGVLTGLPKLSSPGTYASFLNWLTQLVRTKSEQSSTTIDESYAVDRPGTLSGCRRETARTNARLFQMRVVEERSVDDVASALGLTASQVMYRQDDMLRKILAILIKLDT
jgi:hypothetical protein